MQAPTKMMIGGFVIAAARTGIALVACMVVASAQSVPTVFQAVVAANAVQKQLFAAHQNLHQMRPGLASSERDCVTRVLSAVDSFQGALSQAITVGRILTEMKSAEDLNTVRLYYFGQSSQNAVIAADGEVDIVNLCLVDIATPAALVEATKIRDAIIGGRNIFSPFAAKRDN